MHSCEQVNDKLFKQRVMVTATANEQRIYEITMTQVGTTAALLSQLGCLTPSKQDCLSPLGSGHSAQRCGHRRVVSRKGFGGENAVCK